MQKFFSTRKSAIQRIDLSYKQTIYLYPQIFSAYCNTLDIRNILEQHIEGFLDLFKVLLAVNSLGFGSMSEDTDTDRGSTKFTLFETVTSQLLIRH